MKGQWRITFMDGVQVQTPENVELALTGHGAVWTVTGRRPGVGGDEVQTMYPVVNIRSVERIRNGRAPSAGPDPVLDNLDDAVTR